MNSRDFSFLRFNLQLFLFEAKLTLAVSWPKPQEQPNNWLNFIFFRKDDWICFIHHNSFATIIYLEWLRLPRAFWHCCYLPLISLSYRWRLALVSSLFARPANSLFVRVEFSWPARITASTSRYVPHEDPSIRCAEATLVSNDLFPFLLSTAPGFRFHLQRPRSLHLRSPRLPQLQYVQQCLHFFHWPYQPLQEVLSAILVKKTKTKTMSSADSSKKSSEVTSAHTGTTNVEFTQEIDSGSTVFGL